MGLTQTLRDGAMIPRLGFGTYQVPAGDAAKAVREAIAAGYRHIDTAQYYFNEEQVGQAIREALEAGEISRDELFVTTKVWFSNYGDGKTLESLRVSREKLGLDVIDLVLLHQPYGDIYGAWRDLVKAKEMGWVKSIGVSNFSPVRVADLGAFSGGPLPEVNQIEVNPFHQRVKQVEQLQEMGVTVEAWAPFGQGRQGMFTEPVLAEIGRKHGKSVAQVILRWLVQREIVPLAKSVHQERMVENLSVADFELDADDVEQIAGLDQGGSLFFDHEDPSTVEYFRAKAV